MVTQLLFISTAFPRIRAHCLGAVLALVGMGALSGCGNILATLETPEGFLETIAREETNAKLKMLRVSVGGSLQEFEPEVTDYAFQVPHAVSQLALEFQPQAARATATLRINQGAMAYFQGSASMLVDLTVGINTLELEIKSPDQSHSTLYTLLVSRAASASNPGSPQTLTPGANGQITATLLSPGGAVLNWVPAQSPTTPESQLTYQVVYSLNANLATVSDANSQGMIALAWTQNVQSATLMPLALGTTYFFNVLVKDSAGNQAAYVMGALTTPPSPTAPQLTSPSTNKVYSTSATLAISGTCSSETIFTLVDSTRLDLACSGGSFSSSVSQASEGNYAYLLFGEQNNGLLSRPTELTWVRDSTPPEPPRVTFPGTTPFTSKDQSLTLRGTCEPGATLSMTTTASGGSGGTIAPQTVACSPAGTFDAQSTPVTVPNIPTLYTVTLQQSDRAGNSSTQSQVEWLYDPNFEFTPTITTPSTNPYYSSSPTVTVAGTCSSTSTVELVGAIQPQNVITPTGSLSQACSAAGTFSFTLNKATDGVDTIGVQQYRVNSATGYSGTPPRIFSAQARFIWIRDSVPPPSVELLNPLPNTTVVSADDLRVQGTCESGNKVRVIEIQAAGSSWEQTCEEQRFSINPIQATSGTRNFSVKQVDRAGNTSTERSFTWTRNPSFPVTPTISATLNQPHLSNQSTLAIAGTCTPGMNVMLDGANAAEILDSPGHPAGALSHLCSNGAYRFRVHRPVDGVYDFRVTQSQGGNISDAAHLRWQRNTLGPSTQIIEAPPTDNSSGTPTFVFISNTPDSTFKCRLDGGNWRSCSSPLSYTSPADGHHTLQVRATDPFGNEEDQPASHSWTQTTLKTLALYHFDYSGSWTDSSPTAALPLNVSGVAIDSAGKFSSAARFSGNGSAFTSSPSPLFELLRQQMTIDFWLKLDSALESGKDYIVANLQPGWRLKLRTPASGGSTLVSLVFQVSLDGSNWSSEVVSPPFYPASNFNHYAVTWQRGQVRLFINGANQASGAIGLIGSSALPAGSGSLIIGGQSTMGSNDRTLTGFLDEFRLSQGLRWKTNFIPPTTPYTGNE